MERRTFFKACAAAAAAAGTPRLAAHGRPHLYSRARLLDAKGAPLHARTIPANRNFIFHYPFAATPCFLLNLGRPVEAAVKLKTADAGDYEWKGGVGPVRSVV